MFNTIFEKLTGVSLEIHRQCLHAAVEVRCTMRSVRARMRAMSRKVKEEFLEGVQFMGTVYYETSAVLGEFYALAVEFLMRGVRWVSSKFGGKMDRVASHPDVAKMARELAIDVARQTTFPVRLVGYAMLAIVILIKA